MEQQADKKELREVLKALGYVSIPVTFFIVFALREYTILKRSPEYTTGVIVETRRGRRLDHAEYEFIVDGKKYYSNKSFNSLRESVMAGDTCEVVYAGTNPEISDLLEYEDGTLILHHPRLKELQEKERIRKDIRERLKEKGQDTVSLFN